MENKDTGLIIMLLGAVYFWYSYEPPTAVNPLFEGGPVTEGPDITPLVDESSAQNTNNLLTFDELEFTSVRPPVTNIDAVDIPPTDIDFGMNIPD